MQILDPIPGASHLEQTDMPRLASFRPQRRSGFPLRRQVFRQPIGLSMTLHADLSARSCSKTVGRSFIGTRPSNIGIRSI